MSEALQDKLVPVIEEMAGLEVKTVDAWQQAAELLVTIRKLSKDVDDTFDAPSKAAHQAHKQVLAAKKKHSQPLESAENRIKKMLVDFYKHAQDQARVAMAEARADQKSQQDEMALDEAAALERMGLDSMADNVLAKAEDGPMVGGLTVALELPKVLGVEMRKVVKHRVVNPDLVPMKYLMPDTAAIGKVVKALGLRADIDGVEVYEDWSVVVKTGD